MINCKFENQQNQYIYIQENGEEITYHFFKSIILIDSLINLIGVIFPIISAYFQS